MSVFVCVCVCVCVCPISLALCVYDNTPAFCSKIVSLESPGHLKPCGRMYVKSWSPKVPDVESKVAALIISNKISARIDSTNATLHAKHTEQRGISCRKVGLGLGLGRGGLLLLVATRGAARDCRCR